MLYNRNWDNADEDDNTFTQRVLHIVNNTKLELKKICLHEAIKDGNGNTHELKAELGNSINNMDNMDNMTESKNNSNNNNNNNNIQAVDNKLLAKLCPKLLIDKLHSNTTTTTSIDTAIPNTSTSGTSVSVDSANSNSK